MLDYPGNPRNHRSASERTYLDGYVYPLDYTHPTQTTPPNRVYFRWREDRAQFAYIFQQIGCTTVELPTEDERA